MTERLRLAGGWARTVAVGLVVALVMTGLGAGAAAYALACGNGPSAAVLATSGQDPRLSSPAGLLGTATDRSEGS